MIHAKIPGVLPIKFGCDNDGGDPIDEGGVSVSLLSDWSSARPRHRVIWHRNQRHTDRARELRALAKNFAGEKRRAIEREIAEHEVRATTGRNLYLCAVCGAWGMWGPGWAAWGNIDEADAFVCSDGCKAQFDAPHSPARRRARRPR